MKLHYAHKTADLRKLDPMNSKPLCDRIYDEILVGAQSFTPATSDQHKEGMELLGDLMMAHKKFTEEAGEFQDLFGEYMEGSLDTNQWNGQFFTPMQICDCMTMMNFPDKESMISKPEYICDPCCGSGRFMLSIAKHYAKTIGFFNFLIVNVDIDKRALTYCCMNAILNAIPSIHIWGNSLSNEVWDAFAVLPGYSHPWIRVEAERAKEILVQGLANKIKKPEPEIIDIETETSKIEVVAKPVKIKAATKNGQMTFGDLFADDEVNA